MGCALSTDRELALQRTVRSLRTYVTLPIAHPRDVAGIVQGFELALELLWKTLQDRIIELGYAERGPKLTFTAAIKAGLIPPEDEPSWRKMLEDRNLSTHTYSPEWAAPRAENGAKPWAWPTRSLPAR
ncbi:MAG: nucleotidyltransferase substrate binding protein [Fimbriimonadaceae bacterium]|nr:nucleotidyltransferase substrate binding protein [Fimbriimonadaceae bacterium]